MCGIAGYFSFGESSFPPSEEELLTVRDYMKARGPDDFGHWISNDRSIGLSHRRLAIIDLSANGAQPFHSHDNRFVIVFNGEIYNYKELRKDLEVSGYVFRTETDTEVLLYMYVHYGREMLTRLRGMFAFAIWDNSEHVLFAARDVFGIKPFYYQDDGNLLLFASQVKAIQKFKAIRTDPDPAGHAGFLLWGSVPEPRTMYRHIKCLPAGHFLEAGYGKPVVLSSYETVANLLTFTGYCSSENDDMQHALYDSVRHHLLADVKTGVFLSAGIDSSVLASVSKDILHDKLATVSLGFEEYRGTHDDETVLAEKYASYLGSSHQTIWMGRQDFLAEYDRLMDAMDQPSIDGVNTYFVSKAAAMSGMKVALSGLGGDELFAGYPAYLDVPRIVHIFSLFRYVKAVGRLVRWMTVPIFRRMSSVKYAGLVEYGTTWGGAYLLRRGLYMPWELGDIMDPDMAKTGLAELNPVDDLNARISGLESDKMKIRLLEATQYMRNQLLRDADWASMAHSLEVRVPLVDKELWKATANLVHKGKECNKSTLAGTPHISLLPEIVKRRKTGFSIPVRTWIQEAGMNVSATERGYRSWARHLYAAFQ